VITLVEFIAPLQSRPNRDKVLGIMYYRQRYDMAAGLTAEEVRLGLRQARVRRWVRVNVVDVLSKSGHLVDSASIQGNKRLWKLTPSGETYVRELVGLPESEPEVEHDVGILNALVAKIADPIIRGYVEEGIKCLRVGALRACVVFLWIGAVRILEEHMLAVGVSALNVALMKHDPKSRKISKIDEFAYVKDSIALLAAQDLGVLDKGERQTLEEALNLRNRCGHPTKYKPGEKKVASFIEDLASVAFR